MLIYHRRSVLNFQRINLGLYIYICFYLRIRNTIIYGTPSLYAFNEEYIAGFDFKKRLTLCHTHWSCEEGYIMLYTNCIFQNQFRVFLFPKQLWASG